MMIFKHPSVGNWTEELEDALVYEDPPSVTVFDRPSHRVSALLDTEGEPLLVPIPRRAVGFDLRMRK
jgi:hypothetical protein